MGSLVRSVARAGARARSAKAASTQTIVIGKPHEPPVIKADKGLLGGSCNRTACQAPGATWAEDANGPYYCRSCAWQISRWMRGGGRLVDMKASMPVPEPRHCDHFIEDPAQPECLRRFLDYNRLPAAAKYPTKDDDFDAGMEAHLGCPMWRDPVPVLFADHAGRRVRVVMASRFGDVGITTHLDAESGYDQRVAVEDLSNFAEAP
ncbi:hypothetical protein ASF58_11055 [Methylobacterium sp. Leaf125]|uniref:hypothetical protein n=1 Tax=Methylobacterium sp. Leaf125 TaxID=1736265 RepID=UPI0006F3A313|nr:hypothetical protein [Methylobacterium sp. Leaf125]KQQ32070.1 hypothetical protein ASF58_11055 [Methylobacterium sp. Leaf125]